MSIYYRLDKQTDNMHPEGSKKQGLFPRIIRKRTLTLAELSKIASEGTTFNAFEIETVGKLLVEEIVRQLGDGNYVSLDEFGTFSLSAESIRSAEVETDIRSESIRVKRVVFRTSPRLMNRVRQFKFVRKPKV